MLFLVGNVEIRGEFSWNDGRLTILLSTNVLKFLIQLLFKSIENK